MSSLHGLLLIISSSYPFWGNILFFCFTLIELDISELDEPVINVDTYLFLACSHLFCHPQDTRICAFCYNVPHDSKETEFGRRFSISHYKYRGSFSVMSCMEMCRDCHDQEGKNFFPFSDYLHYTMIKRKKSFFSFSHYLHYTMINTEKGFF